MFSLGVVLYIITSPISVNEMFSERYKLELVLGTRRCVDSLHCSHPQPGLWQCGPIRDTMSPVGEVAGGACRPALVQPRAGGRPRDPAGANSPGSPAAT